MLIARADDVIEWDFAHCMSLFMAHRVESLRCEGSDAIGAKRTCRERRERVDLTKMTQSGPCARTRFSGRSKKHRSSHTREGHIWPAFLEQFWIGRQVDGGELKHVKPTWST